MFIEKCGSQYSLWNGTKLVGIYDTYKQAMEAIHNWDRKLWNWVSLYDVEHHIPH